MAYKKNDFTAQMKKNGGYFHDIITNTLYMTNAICRKSNQFGTRECRIMDDLMLRSGNKLTVEVITHKRAPRITYAMMEVFISKMPNAKENFQEYQKACQKSKIARNPYKEVLTWFENAFPYYNDLKVEKDGKLVWNALDEYRKAMEEQGNRSNNIVSLHKKDAEAQDDSVSA